MQDTNVSAWYMISGKLQCIYTRVQVKYRGGALTSSGALAKWVERLTYKFFQQSSHDNGSKKALGLYIYFIITNLQLGQLSAEYFF